ncbi:MAG: glucosyl transferase [Ignavibacteriota bacterium]|jgi:hypothetical protein|nr:glucosyl transferase [Ignavibacteriales bacterium]MBL1124169.1 glucosyl transferase [Ignavibacteriota bacterium]MCC7093783.1 glucosyl transferase [Ignavibacteriaceae bacterium]MCE7857923.1 glucosyl transferase [Ignavibacteria bacterium CHB3]MCZ7614718.1 glucosyl transferase [Ignavibacteriaceae bacterium]
MKRVIFGALIISLNLLLQACNTTEPPPPDGEKPTLTLKLEDVSCTEAWITLTTTNLPLPTTVTLNQTNPTGDTKSQILNLNTQDSLLYIDSLLPNKTYNFIAVVESSEQLDTSNQLQATTLDTTSHIFSYQTFELGDPLTGNSSILYDVAIVDANNIYAVGEIYVLDSLGQTILYNVIHWNGNDWKLKKVYFPTVCGDTSRTPYPSRAIYVFDDGKIWMSSSGDKIAILENGDQINQFCLPASVAMSINRIWGTSSNDLYIVGNNGKIAHYQNGTWQQILSGTSFPLVDIYSKDGNEIYVAGINVSEVKGVVLKGSGNQFSVMINAEVIDESQLFQKLYGILGTVWLDEHNTIYTGGNLLFRYKNNEWNYETSLPENFIGGNPGAYYRGFISSIRGNASNDYIIAGGRNTLKHFNGVSWEQIGLPYDPQSPIIWGSVKMKNNTAVAVGLKNNSAYIILLNK